MKKPIHLIILLCLASFTTFAQPASTKPQVSELSKIVAIANKSIAEAAKKLEGSNTKITIKDAEITLQTIYDKSGGGGFKLFAKASRKWELEKTSTMTFSYSKDEKLIEKSNPPKPITFEQKLTDAIIGAAKQWKESSETVGELKKEKFNVEVSFMVKVLTSGGIEFEVWGVGVDLSADDEKTAVQTISLTFE